MKNYPLNKHLRPNNIKELTTLRAEISKDNIAFEYKVKKDIVRVSYAKLKEDIDSLGTFMYQEGFKNKKIAIIGENSYAWIITYLATIIGSNVIVPVDKELSAEDISSQLQECGTDILFHSKDYADIADELKSNGCIIKSYSFADIDKFIGLGKQSIADGNKEYLENEIDADSVCSIIYTSGTTGRPKGVMLTQGNLAADVISSCENVFIAGKSMLTLPLHHTFAFSTSVLAMLLYGVEISINSSVRHFVNDLKLYKPQNMFLVPLYVETMYKNIWDAVEKQNKTNALKILIKLSNILRYIGIDLRRKLFKTVLEGLGGNLDLIVSGGAYIDEKYIKGFEDLGIMVLNGYGITECSPVVSVNRNKWAKKGSVGLLLSCCDCKIIDGEICIKGSNVMKGYLNNESATKDAFYGKWFKTGDLGYIDEDNYLFITGRRKNLIILSNGKNVSPEELESKILDIKDVIEVVVYAENDNITAEIYAENKDTIENEINNLNKTLPAYMQIQKVKFRDTEFEKTTTKKIKRNYGGK